MMLSRGSNRQVVTAGTACCFLLAYLLTLPVALAQQSAAPPAVGLKLAIAHSALLSIEGTPGAGVLDLTVRHVADQSPVVSDDVTVTVDGKNEPVTRGTGGAYQIPLNDLRGAEPREVDITVGHDGIREILTGKVTLPASSSAGSFLGDHKQIAWWILNIVIVLIAAIAISRRKG